MQNIFNSIAFIIDRRLRVGDHCKDHDQSRVKSGIEAEIWGPLHHFMFTKMQSVSTYTGEQGNVTNEEYHF